jgi:hypothetical protein
MIGKTCPDCGQPAVVKERTASVDYEKYICKACRKYGYIKITKGDKDARVETSRERSGDVFRRHEADKG